MLITANILRTENSVAAQFCLIPFTQGYGLIISFQALWGEPSFMLFYLPPGFKFLTRFRLTGAFLRSSGDLSSEMQPLQAHSLGYTWWEQTFPGCSQHQTGFNHELLSCLIGVKINPSHFCLAGIAVDCGSKVIYWVLSFWGRNTI